MAVAAPMTIGGCGSEDSSSTDALGVELEQPGTQADGDGDPATGTEEAPTDTTPEIEWQSFDPPVVFDTASAIEFPPDTVDTAVGYINDFPFPPLPVTLDGTTIYAAGPAVMETIDADTGQIVSSMHPEETPLWGDNSYRTWVSPPLLATTAGEEVAIAPFSVSLPGSGTTNATAAIELIAMSTTSGERAWSMVIDTPTIDPTGGFESGPVYIAGLEGDTLVLAVPAEATYAVDLTTRTELWRDESFAAISLHQGLAVGARESEESYDEHIAAVSITDGTEQWRSEKAFDDPTLFPAGNRVVMSTLDLWGTPAHVFDIATGAVVFTDHDDNDNLTCHYDQVSITVCRKWNWIGAFDQTSTDWIWDYYDGDDNRSVPVATAVWHGAIYAEINTVPIVLDALTGQDREIAPGAEVWAVNEHLAIGQNLEGDGGWDDARMLIYPAIG
jgi:hypothetical protein